MNFEQPKIEKREIYKENIDVLKEAKRKLEKVGLFDKQFLDDLNFKFLGDFREENGDFKSYELKSDNSLNEMSLEKMDVTKDVLILSQDLLKRYNEFSVDADNLHIISQIWYKGANMPSIYSFGAVVAHEVAHAKSYQVIPPQSGLFNKERFFREMQKLISEDERLKNINIDFSQFNYSLIEWSEIYAMLYQREFVRRENPMGDKDIQEWDKFILETASTLNESVEKFGEEENRKLSPNLIYKENHTLSFLLSRVLEKKFPDFQKRLTI
jgi:hypothetical protein